MNENIVNSLRQYSKNSKIKEIENALIDGQVKYFEISRENTATSPVDAIVLNEAENKFKDMCTSAYKELVALEKCIAFSLRNACLEFSKLNSECGLTLELYSALELDITLMKEDISEIEELMGKVAMTQGESTNIKKCSIFK